MSVTIIPFAAHFPVGITAQPGQTYVPVQLNQAVNTWTITQESDLSILFTIGSFAYTGMNDQQAVIASNDAGRSVKWQVKEQPQCQRDGEADSAYTIQVFDDQRLGWTLSGDQIVVAPLDDVQACDPSQLFYIGY